MLSPWGSCPAPRCWLGGGSPSSPIISRRPLFSARRPPVTALPPLPPLPSGSRSHPDSSGGILGVTQSAILTGGSISPPPLGTSLNLHPPPWPSGPPRLCLGPPAALVVPPRLCLPLDQVSPESRAWGSAYSSAAPTPVPGVQSLRSNVCRSMCWT